MGVDEDRRNMERELAEAWRALFQEPFSPTLPPALETLLLTMFQLQSELRVVRDEVRLLRAELAAR